MRLCILTTETLHHAYFVRELAAGTHEVWAVVVQNVVAPVYDTFHSFEDDRADFESATWFNGSIKLIGDFCGTLEVPDINVLECIEVIKIFAPDMIVTFGTRRLGKDIIACGGSRLFNLHGGDPEYYRGLDSHLWAIWHRDFGSVSTCLHRVEDDFDTGDIVASAAINLSQDMALCELRRSNTEVCVSLVETALSQMETRGFLRAKPQRQHGRYYSFMPAALKSICVNRFAAHTKGL